MHPPPNPRREVRNPGSGSSTCAVTVKRNPTTPSFRVHPSAAMRHSLSLVMIIVGVVSMAVAPKPIRATPRKPFSPSKTSEVDVTNCKHGEKYYIEHIQFVCQHKYDVKALIPNGCYVDSHNTSRTLGINGIYRDKFFVYKCVAENAHVVTYKAISCLMNTFEIPLRKTLRTGKVEYYCEQGIHGHTRIDIRWYLHNLCNTGSVNQTDVNGYTACPGIAKSTIHSKLGFGSSVHYNSTTKILVP
uniref:ZP domain-containing protein n=1 Tax=Panagrellus redivivus TaxID=6233 RepID=A0A7E4VS18_PANRE